VVFTAMLLHKPKSSKPEFDSSPIFLKALQAIVFARGNLYYSGISLLYLRCVKKQAGKKFVQQETCRY